METEIKPVAGGKERFEKELLVLVTRIAIAPTRFAGKQIERRSNRFPRKTIAIHPQEADRFGRYATHWLKRAEGDATAEIAGSRSARLKRLDGVRVDFATGGRDRTIGGKRFLDCFDGSEVAAFFDFVAWLQLIEEIAKALVPIADGIFSQTIAGQILQQIQPIGQSSG